MLCSFHLSIPTNLVTEHMVAMYLFFVEEMSEYA